MYGLIVFGVLGIYLVLLIWATRFGYRFSEKIGWVGKKRWLGAALAFLIVYLPVFWDWIPTVVTHKYYCATEAGFWVYKSLDQWKKENPGVAETLRFTILPSQKTSYGDVNILNERFSVETHRSKPINVLPTTILETRLVDIQTNEVLAKSVHVGSYVSPSTHGIRGYKTWLGSRACIPSGLDKMTAEIERMGEKE